MNLAELQTKTNEELLELAKGMGLLKDGSVPKRQELMMTVLASHAEQNGHLLASGVLSIINEQGYGFLRNEGGNAGTDEVYVSQSQIRRFGLRTGDQVTGQVRPPKDGERYFGLVRVEAVNGLEPEAARDRPHFEQLTPIFPEDLIKMEIGREKLSGRLIDMISPIGHGQRGLIVSPPKAGKTTILKDIASGITANAPDIHLMVALIGERPGGGDGHEAVGGRRGVQLYLRRAGRGPLPRGGAGAGAREASGRGGAGRFRAAGQHHAADACVQPGGPDEWQDAIRRHRSGRALPAEALLRRGRAMPRTAEA